MEKTKVTLWQHIVGYFRAKVETKTFISPESNEGSPVRAGRASVPNIAGASAFNLTTIKPDVPSEYLLALQVMASTNADMSYAVENIVQMGNTPFTIEFEGVSEQISKKMRVALNHSSKEWYGALGARAVLVSNLLDQLAVNGALSYEPVIKKDLSGIQSIALVNPAYIEYKYNTSTLDWEPYQRVTNTIATNRELLDGSLIRLNPRTYTYLPLRQRTEKPYGIPPMLSALDMTSVEGDILDNFRKVAKNIGVLGFLEVIVNKPRRKKSPTSEWMETDHEYMLRCQQYLETVIRPEAEKGFTTGIMTGFEGDFASNYQSNTANSIDGADKFLEAITTVKHAGLKQDPILLGRPFNTSEALGRVILDKFASQVASFQDIVACALTELFTLELVLLGFPRPSIKVKFDRPNVKDDSVVEEARGKKIDNDIKLYNQGIYSQIDVANSQGKDLPDQLEPRISVSPINTIIPESQDEEVIEEQEEELGAFTDYFDYTFNDCCNHLKFSDDTGNESLEKYIKKYLAAITALYDKASINIAKKILTRISNMSSTSTKSQVFNAVYSTLLRNWNREFNSKQKEIVDSWVDAAYRVFRKDKDIFGASTIVVNGKDTKIPKAIFDITDFKTLDYIKKADSFYFGKFITDPDTKARLKQFIYDEFLKGDIPLGQTSGQEAFLAKLTKQLGLERFKLDRIVVTTTNKLRSYANIAYMHQVGVKEYEVVSMLDNKTSDICRKMDGKVFSVPLAKARIVQVSKSLPSSVPRVTPFVSAIFKAKDLNLIDDLTGDTLLQDYSIFAPPYHGNCRTQLIAKL